MSRFSCLSCYVFLASWPATCFRRPFRDTSPLTTPSSTVLRVACGAARTLSAYPPPPNRRYRHSHLFRSPTWMAVRSRRPGEARPGFSAEPGFFFRHPDFPSACPYHVHAEDPRRSGYVSTRLAHVPSGRDVSCLRAHIQSG